MDQIQLAGQARTCRLPGAEFRTPLLLLSPAGRWLPHRGRSVVSGVTVWYRGTLKKIAELNCGT
jgi:hypothetical protein